MRRAGLGVVACATGFALITLLAYAVPAVEIRDAAALSALFEIESLRLDRLADLISHTGDLIPWLAALAGLAWCGLSWGRGRAAVFAGGAAMIAVAASQVLKILLAHPRSQAVLGGEVLGPEALPSGHTTAAMSVAVMAVIVVPAQLRAITVLAGAVYAWAMGMSLMVLAWHLPSDVLAAMLLAGGCGFAAQMLIARYGAGSTTREVPAYLRSGALLLAGLGVAVLVIAMLGGEDRAGRAVQFAGANRSAVLATGLVAVTALGVLVALVATMPGDRPHRPERI